MTPNFDIAVVGGGVIGLSIARRLRIEGASVAVYERGACGRGASWAGAGVLAPPNPHRRDAAAALHLRSLEMYPAFCAELLDETGIDPEYEACGEIEVALDDRGATSLQEDARAAVGRTVGDGRAAFEALTVDEARRMEPAITAKAVGAMLCRETAQVRNPRLLSALRASCEKRGVVIHEGAEVVDFVVEHGSVVGVQLREGASAARITVLCAGAWSTQVGSRLAELMPVRPVRGQMICLSLDRRLFTHVISRGKTYWVPRRDGHVLLGATEEPDAGFTVRNTPEGIAKLIGRGLELVPFMGEASMETTWAGLRPGTPDDLPYLGWVEGIGEGKNHGFKSSKLQEFECSRVQGNEGSRVQGNEGSRVQGTEGSRGQELESSRVQGFEGLKGGGGGGLIAATGHFRSGLGMAPGTAEYVAALVGGRSFPLDLSCCRPGREFPRAKR